jgi:hypothetical protein
MMSEVTRVETVNVIEYADDAVVGLTSFTDTPEGNRDAEARFSKLIKENDKETTNQEVKAMSEDGWYESGTYQVFIIHSSVI